MSEGPATRDLAEIVRRANDAFNRRDVDAWLSFYSPDIVYRPVPTFTDSRERQGLGAMRRLMEEWLDAWADDYTTRTESVREFGDVVIALLRFTGHAKASGVEVAGGIFEVYRFREGKIVSVEDFTDRVEALKAAGVEEWAMSENLDLVRSIYADWERGEFDSADWAHPAIEYVSADGPDPGAWTGPAEMAENFRGWLGLWQEFRLTADEYRQFEADSVIVLDHYSGRGKTSGLDLGQIEARGAWVFHIRDGKVTRMIRYMDRDRALADLGLEEWAVSQENVAIVRRMIKAFNERDVATLELIFSEDVVMRLIGGFADLMGTEFRGQAASRTWMVDWVRTIGGQVEVETLRDVDDRVLAIATMEIAGTLSGTPAAQRYGQVYSFRDGRISSVDSYVLVDDAVKAVGLEE